MEGNVSQVTLFPYAPAYEDDLHLCHAWSWLPTSVYRSSHMRRLPSCMHFSKHASVLSSLKTDDTLNYNYKKSEQSWHNADGTTGYHRTVYASLQRRTRNLLRVFRNRWKSLKRNLVAPARARRLPSLEAPTWAPSEAARREALPLLPVAEDQDEGETRISRLWVYIKISLHIYMLFRFIQPELFRRLVVFTCLFLICFRKPQTCQKEL